MRYVVSTDFIPINETSGTIQNTSQINVVEISDSPTANSGILLYPMGKYQFNTQIYARCVDTGGAELRVVTFEGGGTMSGGGTVDLSGYVEKVAGATQGNFAIFGASGGIVDSSLDADNLVPATVAGDGVKFLRGDRTWSTPTIEPFTIDSVSSTVEGSMWITDWDAPILAVTLGSASSTVEGSMWIVDY